MHGTAWPLMAEEHATFSLSSHEVISIAEPTTPQSTAYIPWPEGEGSLLSCGVELFLMVPYDILGSHLSLSVGPLTWSIVEPLMPGGVLGRPAGAQIPRRGACRGSHPPSERRDLGAAWSETGAMQDVWNTIKINLGPRWGR